MPARPAPATAAQLFLPCAGGSEQLLADELQLILGPATALQPGRGGVALHGDARAAMQLNLASRLAQRVLWQVAQGPYRHEDDLYALAHAVAWEEWITPQQTIRVDVSARSAPLRSLNFAALRIKDALCDRLRARRGERPSVDTRKPDLALQLHLDADQAWLSVDLSGEALFKRGWRDARGGRAAVKGEAALKETLAAAMLAAAGWRGRAEDGALFDPCCGAGTIAIEAAQLAMDMAPGLNRRFAFERLLPFTGLRGTWRDLVEAARARVHRAEVPVFAGDVSFRMTDLAQHNAQRAGVAEAIEFKTADALQRPPPCPRGTLMINPPYGERIQAKGSLQPAREQQLDPGLGDFFARLASHWKNHYPDWTAWVLSPDMALPGRMRLKESRRVPLWNGAIECRLFRFDLVRGSHRTPRPAQPPA